ncbi:MAG: response regulator [Thermovirgaceae bacterium]
MTQKCLRPILLVEDNPLDLDLTMRAFSKSRLSNPIEVARDGAEAIAWMERWEAGQKAPVVILLDLKLPKINGLEVLRQYKTREVSKKIPLVVLTTSEEDRDIRRAYDLGANSYIVKPVVFEKFLEVTHQIEIYWLALNRPPE